MKHILTRGCVNIIKTHNIIKNLIGDGEKYVNDKKTCMIINDVTVYHLYKLE